jgi:phosphohistidine phosphatase
MNLYILRHGIAVERGAPEYPNDADRPLTPKGERKLEQIAEAMEAMELSFDLILSSPYARARQTAEIVAEALHARKKLQFTDSLTPEGSPRKLVELIHGLKQQPDDVLLSGHEPYLSGLISLLVSGDRGLSVIMKKGGLCKLSVEQLKPGRCASLEWLLTPKQMALMA